MYSKQELIFFLTILNLIESTLCKKQIKFVLILI